MAKKKRRRRGICAGAAIVTLVIAVAGCMHEQKKSTNATPASSTPAPPAAVLDGTYRLDHDGAKATMNGAPTPEGNTTTWIAFRSSCTSSGCAATATRLDDKTHQVAGTPVVKGVYHFADGQWQQAPVRDQHPFPACLGPNQTVIAGADTDMSTYSLAPQPDGTLRGLWTDTIVTNHCGYAGTVMQMPLVAARTGDVPPGVTVADPATVTAAPTTSKAPAASAPVLAGVYRRYYDFAHEMDNGRPAPHPNETHWRAFRSLCTKSGCVATSISLSDDNHQNTASAPFVYRFTGGHWQLDATLVTAACPNNQTATNAHTFTESLEPQPDGTLRGVFTENIFNFNNECTAPAGAAQTPLEMTREGLVPPGVILADPALFF